MKLSVQNLRIPLAACLFLAVALAGCNGSPPANEAAVDNQLSNSEETRHGQSNENREFQKLPIAKFAGKVTIDGKPPIKDGKLFVILTDPKHLDQHAIGQLPKVFAVCDADGQFAFGTYDLKNHNDGVVAGKYVVTFVQLHKFAPHASKGKRSVSAAASQRPRGKVQYVLPDGLKNLYSDPDTNATQPAFNLDLQPPGKDDYQFDLAVAGKNPVAKPAPHAVTYMVLLE
jgi:hypothetical protein